MGRGLGIMQSRVQVAAAKMHATHRGAYLDIVPQTNINRRGGGKKCPRDHGEQGVLRSPTYANQP